jgi:hypothetical protein
MTVRAGLQTVAKRNFLSLPAIKTSNLPRSLMTSPTEIYRLLGNDLQCHKYIRDVHDEFLS